MTKSGIGTETAATLPQQQQHGHHHHHQQQQPNVSTSSIVISKTEIPIWVSDRKKWVTGINKRTTVNDLIFAVLKQCQVISGGQLVGIISSGNYNNKQISQSKTSLNEPPGTTGTQQASLMDQIANLFVLAEYYFELDAVNNSIDANHHQQQHHHGQCSSQRLLDNDSKVYKYFNKWLQSPNSYMLKILQRQIPLSSEQQQQQSTQSGETTEQQGNNGNGHSSLASKLLRKFGVSSTNTTTTNTSNVANSSITALSTNNSSSHTSQIPPPHIGGGSGRSSSSYRFVDVKLPVTQQQPQQGRSKSIPQQQLNGGGPSSLQTINNNNNNNHSPTASNSTTSSNNTAATSSSNATSSSDKLPLQQQQQQRQASFDPATQKMFLYNSIVDKESKLRQQRERFKLIDELLKETEKKSSKYMSTNTTDSMLYDSTKPLNLLTQQLKHANIDLTDIYSNFPEMRTNNLEDVEEFSQVCTRLFQLDEDIKEQKDMLNRLESELQRELNSAHLPHNNFSNNAAAAAAAISAGVLMGGESVETMQLRKEVSLSREQTRIQCKQLHDLDAKMRLNEQSLALKEQQLQKLLEELYIEEMYADSALESHEMQHQQHNGRRSRQQMDNEPNTVDYFYEQQHDASHNNQSADDHLIINDELLHMNSDRVELSNQTGHHHHHHNHNHIEFGVGVGEDADDDTLPIHHIDYIDHHLNQMLLNAATAKQIELKINNEAAVSKYNAQPSTTTGGGSIRISGSNSNGHHNNQFMNGLTQSQKSLSYGNLLHGNNNNEGASNSIKINNNLVSPSNQPLLQHNSGQKQNGIKPATTFNKSPNTMTNVNKVSLMKTSPSLDLNKAQQQQQNVYTNKVATGGVGKGVDQSGSGDNDSGISSVSSEATTTMIHQHQHTTMMTTTSSSSSSASCQNVANNVTSIPINMMNQYQRQQYLQQQQQMQRQYQGKPLPPPLPTSTTTVIQSATSPPPPASAKPVLETLV